MKSSIRIEFDFDTKQSVLRIKHDNTSDDLRDQMLKDFIQKASFTNSRLYVTYPTTFSADGNNPVVEIRCEDKAEQTEAEQTHFFVQDNSKAFAAWLDEQRIYNVGSGHFTKVYHNGDLSQFDLGCQWTKFKMENMPK